MQRTQKSAPKAKPQRKGCFGFKGKRSIVESKFAKRLTQILILRRIYGIEPRKYHRFYLLKTFERFFGRSISCSYRISDFCIEHFLHMTGQKSDLASSQLFDFERTGSEKSQFL